MNESDEEDYYDSEESSTNYLNNMAKEIMKSISIEKSFKCIIQKIQMNNDLFMDVILSLPFYQ